MYQMTTPEGSPRAALLQQSMQRANVGAFSPVSPARPPMMQPQNGAMTIPQVSTQARQNTQQSAQLLSLLQGMKGSNYPGPPGSGGQPRPGGILPLLLAHILGEGAY